MKSLALGLAAVAILLVASQQAFAQGGAYYMGSSDNPVGPTVSPYLNLVGSNQIGSITNYQSLVKPLIEQNSAINRQGNAVRSLQQQVSSGGGGSDRGGGRGTGHASFFMNYSHFYYASPAGR
jgi:hypothetical protein